MSTTLNELFPPSDQFRKKAKVQDDSLYQEANVDPIAFWEKQAENLVWFRKHEMVFRGTFMHPEWFVGAKLNASYNCLDRHLSTPVRDKVAIHWEGENKEERCLTYLELYRETCRMANAIKKLGIKKGDKVAIFLPLIPEAIAAMLACARIGAVHTVIFAGIGVESVQGRILHAEAKLLITADGGYRRGKVIPLKETADEAIENTAIEKVLVIKRCHQIVSMKQGRDFFYEDLFIEDHCPAEIMDAEDPLFILYTSGSTGKPKGIYHTTAGYLTGVYTTCSWVFDIHADDVYWCTADLGWITGHSYVVYGPLMNGATQVIYEGAFDTPDCGRVWRLIEKYAVSIFYTAPTAIRTFIKWGISWPRSANLSSLRLLGSIGEPINPDVWHWYREEIGQNCCPIVDTWFQTETGALAIAPLPGITSLKAGSITRALPGVKVAVLDEEGRSVSKGSLAIMSPFPSMMRGCYRDEERYKSTYWSKWGGKYYYAGDAAQQDEDGYFWVTGRQDEVLKVSGHRIGTAEVESALVEHPSVAEAGVIGAFDPITGEKIYAFVILKEKMSHEALETELQLCAARKLGSYAKPQRIFFTPELPKTRSGKIMRRILKSIVENTPVGDTTTLENPHIIDVIRGIIA